MIQTDESGQKWLDVLSTRVDELYFTDYERSFVEDLIYKGLKYKNLTSKQKTLMGEIYERRVLDG